MTKTVTYAGKLSGSPETWQYSCAGGCTETAPDGGVTVHVADPVDYRYGSGGPYAGMVKSTQRPDGSKSVKVWSQNIPFGVPLGLTSAANPWVKAEYEHAANASKALTLTSGRVYTVDKNGNQTSAAEYHWTGYDAQANGGAPAGAVLLRTVGRSYQYPTANTDDTSGSDETNLYNSESDTAPKLLALVTAEGITGLSRSEYDYDANGNVTFERHGNTEKGALASPLSANTYDLVSHTYDTSTGKYGILTQTVDARGYTTKFDYGPVTSCSFAGTSANPSGAYATQETRAFGQTEQQIWSYGYEPCTGLRTTVTDPNSVITTTGYDSFGRQTSVTEGGARATYTK